MYRRDVLDTCTRGFDFEVRSTSRDGRRLEGYVAVFNVRARVPDRNGDFEEEIAPGFADRSLREHGYPVMQFDHGRDPRVGTVPIGVYEEFEPDKKGYHVRGQLFDNPVVEPVRQAIAGKAIKGMSWRMRVSKDGDKWERRSLGMDLRRVHDATLLEAGPVVFPAYSQTSVSVRSLWAAATDEECNALIEQAASYLRQATDLTSLTGQSRTRSAGGGDTDVESREDDTSRTTSHQARARALLLTRSPIVLP